jgi:SAM-dependent methyltransferase
MLDVSNNFKQHDLSLHSGERQVAIQYGDIRADHRFRYEWADDKLPPGGFGSDIFCGNGYGSWFLSEKRILLGIDGSSEAIRLAEQYYRRSRTFFSAAHYPFSLPENVFDFIVSLESVEHVENGRDFFRSLTKSLKPGGALVFSTPCEESLPIAMTDNPFHYKHYSFNEAMELASSDGLKLVDWAGQDTYSFLPDGRQGNLLPVEEMKLKRETMAQFLIFFSIKNG